MSQIAYYDTHAVDGEHKGTQIMLKETENQYTSYIYINAVLRH